MTKLSVFSLVFIAIFGCHVAYGMDCSLGTSKDIISEFISHCPRPLFDSSDESYCCWKPNGIGDKYDVHCCTFVDFVFNSISLALPIIIICLVVSFIVSCVCCLCCPCCCFYKRRSGGSVERLQIQHQQLQIQQQQVLLQQQQLELELQRQQLLVQQQQMLQQQPVQLSSQFPPPYSAPVDNKN
ncbi:uncharacterized protein LOC124355299 isoform X1 [Homalodisca vitripennis]|uniref:uncharacterized protein LOC124355299 isoform X1 n=1 Tax=Homalodisca vitripennis TaxID=197043 RepID=UPI001EEBC16D|nr:uncharacterized protein LOC124355299 isoform X1 [Homalodisca vitripennis]XP_046662332.1 uncharacterized protein LOC124355299 isoform X1 [Homalodisca vitripennis]